VYAAAMGHAITILVLLAMIAADFYMLCYEHGKCAQRTRDKLIIDEFKQELVEKVEAILERQHPDPNRPNYLDRQ